jgi:hypothetical protein
MYKQLDSRCVCECGIVRDMDVDELQTFYH